MRRLKRVTSVATAAVVAFSSLLSVGLVPTALAATDTCTWTGTTDDKWNTATNWSCSTDGADVPDNGDSLIFNATGLTATEVTDNDMTSLSVANITFQGSNSGNHGFAIEGNSLTITSGLTNSRTGGTEDDTIIDSIGNDLTITGNQTVSIPDTNTGIFLLGDLGGSGNLTKTGAGGLALIGDNASYTGTITANGGNLVVSQTNGIGTGSAPGAVINNGADFTIIGCDLTDFAGNLTLNGDSSITTGDFPNPKLGSVVDSCSGDSGSGVSYGGPSSTNTLNLNGAIVLGSDITFAGITGTTKIKGALSGAHTITMLPGYTGKLVVDSASNTSSLENGTYESAKFAATLSDDQASKDIDVFGNNTITLDGKRGDVVVFSGGVVMGTGTAGTLSVQAGGTVAPGHSPGCLNTGNLTEGGTYAVEVGGADACTGYDQLNVTGTVDVTNGMLTISRYNDFKPTKGQVYTIIKNDAADAVTGTFTGLAEGATVTVDGYVLAVSYKGGDGNDVVLTVQTVPAAPDTGFGAITANPLATLAGTVLAAGAILVVAQRSRKSLAR